jgi:riboflavin synthase
MKFVMFTGIVEEIGEVASIRATGRAISLAIRANKVLEDVRLGDSIAVNGICLTVVSFDRSHFVVDVVPETMRRTTLHELAPGHLVNLERAMAMGGRFGGHIVSGHIDGVGRIVSIAREDTARVIRIAAPSFVMRYVVPKGSITVDGVSLTVMDVDAESFRVSIIPHTGQVTILKDKQEGSRVNLECDIIGKYVEKLLTGYVPDGVRKPTGENVLTTEFLREHGFA